MQIGDTVVANLQRRSYVTRDLIVWQCIQQGGRRAPHKVQSPNRYQERADTPNQRINPSAGYMIGLSGPGLEIARRMDLMPKLEAAACVVNENVYRDTRGRELLRLRYREFLKDPPYVALRRTSLVQALREALDPDALAAAVGLSESKLKAGFKVLVGKTVRSYLREVRIDRACALIEQGHTVTESALAAGFQSLSHFSKTFREVKGVYPRDFSRIATEGDAPDTSKHR